MAMSALGALWLQLSHGSPLAAVCARGDLDAAFPDARGCFDTKVTSYDLALELQADAITGPTTEVGCCACKSQPCPVFGGGAHAMP